MKNASVIALHLMGLVLTAFALDPPLSPERGLDLEIPPSQILPDDTKKLANIDHALGQQGTISVTGEGNAVSENADAPVELEEGLPKIMPIEDYEVLSPGFQPTVEDDEEKLVQDEVSAQPVREGTPNTLEVQPSHNDIISLRPNHNSDL